MTSLAVPTQPENVKPIIDKTLKNGLLAIVVSLAVLTLNSKLLIALAILSAMLIVIYQRAIMLDKLDSTQVFQRQQGNTFDGGSFRSEMQVETKTKQKRKTGIFVYDGGIQQR